MSDALLLVRSAGPHVSVQDNGRPGLMRYGVPCSGPLDRLSFAAANLAVGNDPAAPAVEVSLGGLVLECLSGRLGFAVAGGGFVVDRDGRKGGSWTRATLAAGERLSIRPGPWGSWCYLALAGRLQSPAWLGSASTHALSGLGGGRLSAGGQLHVAGARPCEPGRIPCPVAARPRTRVRVTMGPQQRFFTSETLSLFRSGTWRMTDAWDRMGVRLAGPPVTPGAALDMPSEPIVRGSVQVAGDGVATVLLADHQTTGGYPKIATVLDCDLDGFVQLRPGNRVVFEAVNPQRAIGLARTAAQGAAQFRASLLRRG